MLLWARAGSTRRCLEAQARQPPRSLPLGPFWTIGVEGSGHHLIEAMHPILCNGRGFRNGSTVAVRGLKRCGGQSSFPSGSAWRQRAIISPDSKQKSCASLLAGGADSKFIFVLRDPVDATISTLGRFWNHKEMRSNDTLIKELAAARMGWRHVAECLRALPCERSLILSYELLGLFPHAHAARLAAFLGTPPTDEHMLGWLRSVRPPSPNTAESVRASWEAAAESASAPTASPYSCSDERNTVVAGKLQAEVALWHKNDAVWRETRPWIVPSNPFPWPQDDGSRVVEPPWVRACDAEWADGMALATPAYLAARCLDTFRAALRQWFYGETDEMATDALPRAPLSREPCTGASVELSTPSSTLDNAHRRHPRRHPHRVKSAPSECSAGVLTDLFNVTTRSTTQARLRWREAIYASQHPADCARAALCTCVVSHGQLFSAIHGDAVCLLAAVLQNCTLVDAVPSTLAKRDCEAVSQDDLLANIGIKGGTALMRDCHLQKLSPCGLADAQRVSQIKVRQQQTFVHRLCNDVRRRWGLSGDLACFGDVTAFVMRPQSAVHRMIHNLAASMGLGSCPGHTPLDETAAVHVRQWVWQKPPLRSLPLT